MSNIKCDGLTVNGTNVGSSINNMQNILNNLFSYQKRFTTLPTEVADYEASWVMNLGNGLKLCGGTTPATEGNKTVYAKYNNEEVFSTCVFWVGFTDKYVCSTSQGWQYVRLDGLNEYGVTQTSKGGSWIALGI